MSLLKNKALGLILVQVTSKIFGILREIIMANFFGSSVIFADYLKLMSYSQIISIFYSEGGLSANLMRKFSIINKRDYSFKEIKKQGLYLSFIIFAAVLIIQFLAQKYIIKSDYDFNLIILLCAITSGIVFFFNIGQIVLVSKAEYKYLYRSTFFRSFTYLVLLYPLIFVFNILGAVLDRLFSVLTQYFNTWLIINKIEKNKERKSKLKLSALDFNIWIFLTNNNIFLLYTLFRVLYSFFPGKEIIYLTYGFILSLAFDGVIIKSLSLYILERSVNSTINLINVLKKITMIGLASLLAIIFLARPIIDIVFNLNKKFSEVDVNNIHYYLIVIFILVFFNGLLNLLFQRVFSEKRNTQFFYSKRYVISILTSIIITSFISFVFTFDFFSNLLYPLSIMVFGIVLVNIYFMNKLIKLIR
ncbi:hypothetical protein ACSIGC_06080 [Tenacibaculum sp. ZS6-P6]|uniref:hypothetical protein n=1 Tax=Tenacibaculum sp. ZS6-P6 TaxID=3447503 RepID=UPI003F9DCE57